jgi:hypothetical protein
MDDKRQAAMSRRGFFGAVAGASTAAAAAAAAFGPTEAKAYDPGEAETKARYRETEHVKAFYRVNGYQTLKK